MDDVRRVRGNLILETQIVEDGELILHQGKIVEINHKAFHARYDYRFSSELISPGLIDTHVHGVQGHDVMDATVGAMEEISKYLLTQGTTSFLATTMSASHDHIVKALTAVSRVMSNPLSGARVLGVHMEGPYVSLSHCGAQNPNHLRYPSMDEMRQYFGAVPVRMITMAPELEGFEDAYNLCQQQGVAVSLGHTGASFERMKSALEQGIEHVTHLFNGMPPMHHRNPGPAAAALMAEHAVCELICDGVHVDPAWVALLHKLLGSRIVLVSDAMRAAGLSDGQYQLGGQPVTVKDSVARTEEGHLAGSTLSLLQGVINFQRFTECAWPEALWSASTVPARFLGVAEQIGSIAVGKDADLVVFNPSRAVPILTIQRGHAVNLEAL